MGRYFSYPQPDGTVIKRYIEPLHGIGRHPWAVCYKHNFQMLYDVRYLMPEHLRAKLISICWQALTSCEAQLLAMSLRNGCRAGTKRPRGPGTSVSLRKTIGDR